MIFRNGAEILIIVLLVRAFRVVVKIETLMGENEIATK